MTCFIMVLALLGRFGSEPAVSPRCAGVHPLLLLSNIPLSDYTSFSTSDLFMVLFCFCLVWKYLGVNINILHKYKYFTINILYIFPDGYPFVATVLTEMSIITTPLIGHANFIIHNFPVYIQVYF